jgi:aerobic carbon-monoxide dehydrogenase small subunit
VTLRVELDLNGRARTLDVDPGEFLVDTLRDRLGLTGVKASCGMGECGTCTVLLDGLAVFSCLTLTAETHGRTVVTVEGLGQPGEPSALQRSFADLGAIQCGYCTPGMLVSATALLATTPRPDEASVRRALAGNLCRCTGYAQIVDAVLAADSVVEPAP